MEFSERVATYAALGDAHRLAIVDALAFSDLTASALAELTGLPSNLLAHHLGLLEHAGIIARTRSEGDGRRRYIQLAADHVRPLLGPQDLPVDRVAFVCTHNSARSQFAAARFEQITGEPAASAGTHPADSIHPGAIAEAHRYGLDLTIRTPRHSGTLPPSGLVVSVCDRALEYGLPRHQRHLHWSIPDPARTGEDKAFRSAFAEIDRRLVNLLTRTRNRQNGA